MWKTLRVVPAVWAIAVAVAPVAAQDSAQGETNTVQFATEAYYDAQAAAEEILANRPVLGLLDPEYAAWQAEFDATQQAILAALQDIADSEGQAAANATHEGYVEDFIELNEAPEPPPTITIGDVQIPPLEAYASGYIPATIFDRPTPAVMEAEVRVDFPATGECWNSGILDCLPETLEPFNASCAVNPAACEGDELVINVTLVDSDAGDVESAINGEDDAIASGQVVIPVVDGELVPGTYPVTETIMVNPSPYALGDEPYPFVVTIDVEVP